MSQPIKVVFHLLKMEVVFHFQKLEVVFHFSSWVKIRLHTENQLPRLSGSGWGVGSYPLLSQAPTPVEVKLGCDNIYQPSVTCYELLAVTGRQSLGRVTPGQRHREEV